jgi:hypothetical protein
MKRSPDFRLQWGNTNSKFNFKQCNAKYAKLKNCLEGPVLQRGTLRQFKHNLKTCA